jgi:hypothetical protein
VVVRRFLLAAGTLLVVAAAGGAVWFFAIEERPPGIAGGARFAARVMGVAICAAVGLGLLRAGLALPPGERPPAEDDERAGW